MTWNTVIDTRIKLSSFEMFQISREALESRDLNKLKELMDSNFDLRRKLYGDDVIGAENLQMINLARQVGLQN